MFLTSDKKLLAIIALIAIALRVIYCVGFIGKNLQDDGVYITEAQKIIDGRVHFNKLTFEKPLNPIEQFPLRIGFNYPLALCIKLFGKSDISLSLFPILCSIVMLFTTYKIALISYNRTTALMASGLFAIFPFDILWSTRVLSDETVGMWIALAFLMFLGEKTKHIILCGICLGMAYLNKSIAIPFAALFLMLTVYKKPINAIYFVFGFCVVWSLEYWLYGSMFYHYRVDASTNVFKFVKDGSGEIPFGYITIKFAHYLIWYFEFLLMGVKEATEGMRGDLAFTYLAIIGMSIRSNKNGLFLLIFTILTYLILEIAPIGFAIENNTLVWERIISQARFLTVLTVPLVIFAAVGLIQLYRRCNMLGIVAGILLLITSYYSLTTNYHVLILEKLRK
jgi:4-amino-4-deoxy-L-arabinose transferase-like glycosyltransferase